MTDQLDVMAQGRGAEQMTKVSNPTAFQGLFQSTVNQYMNNPFRYKSSTHDEYDKLVKVIQPLSEEIVIGLITDGSLDVYTAQDGIMPFATTESLNYKLDTLIIDPPMPSRVPYEGVVKLVSFKRTTIGGSLARMGLGFYMEIESLATQEGQETLSMYLFQIAQAVKELCAYDTTFSLLNCLTYEKKQLMLFGHLNVSYTQIMQHEMDNFVPLAKDCRGFDVLVETGKMVLKRSSKVADTIMIPPTTTVYFNMLQKEKTDYFIAGPSGPVTFKKDASVLATFRDLTVVVCKYYSTSPDKQKEDPLQRIVSIGEYYKMMFARRDEKLKRYESKERNIYIYNENIDDFEKILFKDALLNSNIFDKITGGYVDDVDKFFLHYNEHKSKLNAYDFLLKYKEKTFNENSAYYAMKSSNPNKLLPLSIATIQENEDTKQASWQAATFFGQMLSEFVTFGDLCQVATSLLLKQGYNESSLFENLRAFNDLKDVIKGIQNQPYVREYWEQLIITNLKRQLDSDGTFIGEKTPQVNDPIRWGENRIIKEWKPDLAGCMRLPQMNLNDNPDVLFPAGFASGYGLLSLYLESNNPKSCWYSLALRIKPALDLIKGLVSLLKSIIPYSLFLDPDSRSAWFHKEDAVATFINNCLPLNSDPIFLSSAKDKDAKGNNNELDDQDNTIYYSSFEYQFSDQSGGLFDGPTDGNLQFQQINQVDITKDINNNNTIYILYTNPVTGKNMIIPRISVSKGFIPKYLSLYYLLGASTADLYTSLLTKLQANAERNAQKLQIIEKFASAIMTLSTINKIEAQKIISFYEKKDNNEIYDSLVDFVNSYEIQKGKNELKVLLQKKRPWASEPADNTPPRQKADRFESLNITDNNVPGVNEYGTIAVNVTDEGSQLIMDLYNLYLQDLNDAKGAGLGLNAFDVFLIDKNVTFWNRFSQVVYNPASYNAIQAGQAFIDSLPGRKERMAELINKVKTYVKAPGKYAEEKLNYERKQGLSNDQIFGNEFYRSPLTMSLELLNSIQGLNDSLIKPSDPETGHTEPIVVSEDEEHKLPGSLWRRTHYLNIEHKMDSQNSFDINFIPSIDKMITGKSSSNSNNKNKKVNNHGNNDNDSLYNDFDFSESDMFHSKKRNQSYINSNSNNYDYDSEFESSKNSKKKIKSNNIGAFFEDEYIDPNTTKSQMRSMKNTNAYSSKQYMPHGEIELQSGKIELQSEFMNHIMRFRFEQVSKCEDPILRMILNAILVLPLNMTSISRMIDADVHVPFNVTLWRNNMTHSYSSCIILKRGYETGVNFVHRVNMMMQADATIKTLSGGLTFHHGAVVRDNRNVFVLSEIKPESYHGGCNTLFVTQREDLQNESKERPSIIATLSPITETDLPVIASISGNLPIAESSIKYDNDNVKHYINSSYYSSLYGWEHKTRNALANEKFSDAEDRVNVVCAPGAKFTYNQASKIYDCFEPSKGHRGVDGNGRGCAAIWNGKLGMFPKMEANSYRLI
jgi:hypothetical protein